MSVNPLPVERLAIMRSVNDRSSLSLVHALRASQVFSIARPKLETSSASYKLVETFISVVVERTRKNVSACPKQKRGRSGTKFLPPVQEVMKSNLGWLIAAFF